MRNRRGSPASSGLKGRASQARKPHNCRMFRASAVEPSRGAALAADAYREWQLRRARCEVDGAILWLAPEAGCTRDDLSVPMRKKDHVPPLRAGARRAAGRRGRHRSSHPLNGSNPEFGRAPRCSFPDDRSSLSNAR
jgi:hypothetical protein